MAKPIATNKGTLREGMIVGHAGQAWEVKMVNDCRAFIVPLALDHVVVKSSVTGDKLAEFDRQSRGISISPQSQIAILAWTRNQLSN